MSEVRIEFKELMKRPKFKGAGNVDVGMFLNHQFLQGNISAFYYNAELHDSHDMIAQNLICDGHAFYLLSDIERIEKELLMHA